MRGLALAVAGAVFASSCGGNALAPTTVQPSPGSSTGKSSARISLTAFVAFGDSITWGEDGRNDASEPLGRIRPQVKVSDPYPALLNSYLQTRYPGQAVSVANAGQPGEPAGAAEDRFVAEVVGGAYQCVLLMEGANDLGTEGGIPAATSGLRAMIDDAKAHGIRVFLATIPPEQQNAEPSPIARNYPEPAVLAMNGAIHSLAASEGVTLVDVYEAFPSPDTNDLYALGLLSRDGLHPLQGGYDVIARAFLTQIVQELELPPAVVLPTGQKS